MAKLEVPIVVDVDAIREYLEQNDIVEVVRCKDCKYKYLDGMVWNCPFGLPGGEDFFCYYGERRG